MRSHDDIQIIINDLDINDLQRYSVALFNILEYEFTHGSTEDFCLIHTANCEQKEEALLIVAKKKKESLSRIRKAAQQTEER